MDLKDFIIDINFAGRITASLLPGEWSMRVGRQHSAAFQEDVKRAADRVRLHSASEKM